MLVAVVGGAHLGVFVRVACNLNELLVVDEDLTIIIFVRSSIITLALRSGPIAKPQSFLLLPPASGTIAVEAAGAL